MYFDILVLILLCSSAPKIINDDEDCGLNHFYCTSVYSFFHLKKIFIIRLIVCTISLKQKRF